MSDLDTAIARLAERGRQAKADLESDRERNAREMPETAAIVRQFNAIFGRCPFKFTENGRTLAWGERTRDRGPLGRLMEVSQFVAALKSGAVRPTGEIRERRRKPVWNVEGTSDD